jgi:hypothetical protein
MSEVRSIADPKIIELSDNIKSVEDVTKPTAKEDSKDIKKRRDTDVISVTCETGCDEHNIYILRMHFEPIYQQFTTMFVEVRACEYTHRCICDINTYLCNFDLDNSEDIMEEKIKEIMHPTWICNPVLVKNIEYTIPSFDPNDGPPVDLSMKFMRKYEVTAKNLRKHFFVTAEYSTIYEVSLVEGKININRPGCEYNREIILRNIEGNVIFTSNIDREITIRKKNSKTYVFNCNMGSYLTELLKEERLNAVFLEQLDKHGTIV